MHLAESIENNKFDLKNFIKEQRYDKYDIFDAQITFHSPERDGPTDSLVNSLGSQSNIRTFG